MLIDKGFFVENYVGTYEMEYNQELDATMIVSKEVNHAESGEVALRKKRIFEFDRRDDEYIFLELTNVNVDSDDAILSYCNKYGLPYSSQSCYNAEAGLDQSVEPDVAGQINRRINGLYTRNDSMDRLEFCRLVVQIRGLMELKEVLDSKTDDAAKLIPLLTYLVFYSRAFIYEYDGHDPLPRTRIFNLQYSFHLFCRIHPELQQLSPADKISAFLNRYKHLIENQDSIKSTMILSDLMAVENLRALHIFEEVFTGAQYSESVIMFPNGPLSSVQSDEQIFQAREFNIITSSINQFTVDNYGRIVFTDKIKYNGDASGLRQLGFEVLRDAVNEGLMSVNPKLILTDSTMRGEWELRYQMEGIYMELFIEIAQDSQYRACANPTCGRFFSASRSRPGKKFCCHECAVLQAKRNERKRNKLKNN